MSLKNWLTNVSAIRKPSVASPASPTTPLPGDGSDAIPSDLRQEAISLAREISVTEAGYQPFYGLPELGDGLRKAQLLRNCGFVINHFGSVQHKQNVRILDIGCNCGFITFTLAETFTNVRGLDVSPRHFDLCRAMAHLTRSNATFGNEDILALMERDEIALEQVDCVLLLSVVHQFIQKHGLAYTQTMIARLVHHVDVVFVELARRAEYVPHGLLLPENPEDHFALCEDADIALLADTPRPVYRLTRRRVAFGHIQLQPTGTAYGRAVPEQMAKKYYRTEGQFLKVYRFGENHPPTFCIAEIAAMLRMQKTGLSPRLIDWSVTPTFGALLMERIAGSPLCELLATVSPADRKDLARQFIHLTRVASEAIGFHNALTIRNLIRRTDGTLMLLNYAQSSDTPSIDPFAVLLWGVHDIAIGAPISFRSKIYRNLVLDNGRDRADHVHYPSDYTVPDADFAGVVQMALNADDWISFIRAADALWNR